MTAKTPLNWLLEKIVGLMTSRFYGTLEITFHEGAIMCVKTVTQEKPPFDNSVNNK